MAVISFHLRNPQATKPTPVFMSLYADGRQTKIKTGLRIDPKQWNADEQNCRTRGKGLLATNGQTNTDLAGMAERAVAYYGKERATGRLATGAEIWDAIKPSESKEADTGPQPLVDFALYLDALKSRTTSNTIGTKRTAYNHLCAYAKASGKPLTYASFTLAWRDKFGAYLAEKVGLSDSTLSGQLIIIRAFLAYAHQHYGAPKIDFTGWAWKHKDAEVVPLTVAEVEAIATLSDLSPRLQNARDLFLLMCYTSLRYSDAVRLKPEYDKGEYLELANQKTDEVLVIYIRKALRPILGRYWEGKVKHMRNRPLNEAVRELALMAGITTPMERVRYYNQTSRTVKETVAKYELLGCHSGRRTFVTQALEKDAPADVVMQATGHRNYRTLQRYNKTTPTRQMAAMRKVWDDDEA
jgi:integrase